jgi:hypothetical protein
MCTQPSPTKFVFPFPEIPISQLVTGFVGFKTNNITDLRNIEDYARKESDRKERYSIEAKIIAAYKLKQQVIAKQQDIHQTESFENKQEIESLKALAFVTELSACMCMSMFDRAEKGHRMALYTSKHMLKSSSHFHVNSNGKIERKKQPASFAKWDPIPEDFTVSEEFEDSDDSDYSVDSVDSVDSEEE